MAVFRVEKSKDYTVMSNHHLRNSALSLKAKGLLSQMLSLPEGWDYTLAGLARINREGEDAISTAVKELEQHGYIRRQRTQKSDGTFSGIEYVIYEQPIPAEPLPENPEVDNPEVDNPEVDYPEVDYPVLENPGQLNKDISNKEIKKDEKGEGLKRQRGKVPAEEYDPSPSFAQFVLSRLGDTPPARDVYTALLNFANHRKAIKKPIRSQAAVTALQNKLMRYAAGKPALMVDLLDTAVSSGWQTVYPPKSGSLSPPKQQTGERKWEEL